MEQTITTTDRFGRERTYRIVEKMPARNWFVWNIGENMGSEEYIPIARPDPTGRPYGIDPNHICAIRLPREDVLLLRKAASAGCESLDLARKEMARKRRSKLSRYLLSDSDLAKVIDVFERLY